MKLEQKEDLIFRMAKAKSAINSKGYINIYEYRFGKQADRQKMVIRNVWNLRVVDEKVTKNFEIIAGEKKSRNEL